MHQHTCSTFLLDRLVRNENDRLFCYILVIDLLVLKDQKTKQVKSRVKIHRPLALVLNLHNDTCKKFIGSEKVNVKIWKLKLLGE